MDKFRRTKLDRQGLSFKESIQKNIDLAKELGRTITWKQAKSMEREARLQEIWVNDIYQVNILRGENCDGYIHHPQLKGKCDYISIKTHNKEAVRDWRHFQQIKNELVGEHREAIEIFPSEDRLVDTANQYHLWVLPEGFIPAFGFTERLVNYTPRQGGYNKSGQRGLE